MPRRTTTFDTHYEGLPINTFGGAFSCELSILRRTKMLLDDYISAHSQILVVGYVLKFSNESGDMSNCSIENCMHKLCDEFNRLGYDPGYLWVREQKTSQHQHYHLALLINRNKCQSVKHLYRIVSECWGEVTSSGVVEPMSYKILRRNSPTLVADYADCFYWLSYWAKTNTKDRVVPHVRRFSTSQPKLSSCWTVASSF